jgi:ATP-dependent RNA helicase RhlE
MSELSLSHRDAINELGKHTGLRGIAIYGGKSIKLQNQRLRGGAEIVVACPGRLLDHLWQGTISLSNLQVLVIDEADRMFDMGFLPDIRSILRCIMNKRQTLLFSATMPPDIRRLVQEILHDPVTVKIGRTMPAATVSHFLYPVRHHLKTALLKDLLRKVRMESVLVFTRTKHRAERLAQQLTRAGHRAISLQGNLSQERRQAALNGFRAGSYKILVATDIAARGIDVLDISHVINYDMPDCTDAYIHRIGRTGRVGKAGDAFTFVTSEDAGVVHNLEHLLNTKMERRTLRDFDYTAPATERNSATAPRSIRRGRRLIAGC